VSANNHYAVFGAATENLFRGMMNVNPLNWEIDNKFIQTTTASILSKRATRVPINLVARMSFAGGKEAGFIIKLIRGDSAGH
jgi:hypothetical protein